MEASKRALLLEPTGGSLHYTVGISYEGTGKLQEAISEYQKAVEMWGGSQSVVALAHAYRALGRRAQAEKMLRDLQHKLEGTSASHYTIATIYAGLGDKDKAFEFLEKAYQERAVELASSLKADLTIASLRSDIRFQNLLGGVGLAN